MADQSITDLLLNWEEKRQAGLDPSAEELCAQCPELLDEVGKRIRQLKASAWMESDAGSDKQGSMGLPSSQGSALARKIRLRGISDGVEGRIWESPSILRVGRLTTLNMTMNESSVSRRHAEVRLSEKGWTLRDFGSTNGTFLNNHRLGSGEWPIKNLDVVRFGDVAFVVEIVETASLHEIGGGSGLVGRHSGSGSDGEPISGQPSIPIFGNTDCPNVTELAPPSPGNHPAIWKVTIPGNRPLATPAIANGKVFVGGGFGSHEFYVSFTSL